ncbi:ABC transporter permease [Granulosicoccaceae sp. 1_MG-2023]|nr:ABC transporter permease [Granulosicoccaceae sp. 1_MG-2023]
MWLAENIVAFRTIVIKEIMRFVRIWVQTLVPPAINAFLYMVIFGTLIGSQIENMSGHPYIEYIVPGIIMMSVITNSYGNVVSSFYSTKFQRNIEELLISPVSNFTILAGYVAGGVARGFTVGALVALVSLLFTDLQVHSFIHMLLIMFLTSTLFSLGGFINAVFARSFDDISIIPNFVLTPLTYLGGIFYSISILPAFWQKVSLVNPVLYMINGFRLGVLGESDIPVSVSYLVILAFIGVLGYWAMWLLRHGVGIRT